MIEKEAGTLCGTEIRHSGPVLRGRYYARPSPSIMPGQTRRDTGHKALMPGVNLRRRVITSCVEGSQGVLSRIVQC